MYDVSFSKEKNEFLDRTIKKQSSKVLKFKEPKSVANEFLPDNVCILANKCKNEFSDNAIPKKFPKCIKIVYSTSRCTSRTLLGLKYLQKTRLR
jgi:hypothetical protein